MGPFLPVAVAEAETSYQCSRYALIKTVTKPVATEASEVCLARWAGAFESQVMPMESFAEDEELGFVLVRASWLAWLHSEGKCWTDLLQTLEGGWGETRHCYQQTPRGRGEWAVLRDCWQGVKASKFGFALTFAPQTGSFQQQQNQGLDWTQETEVKRGTGFVTVQHWADPFLSVPYSSDSLEHY